MPQVLAATNRRLCFQFRLQCPDILQAFEETAAPHYSHIYVISSKSWYTALVNQRIHPRSINLTKYRFQTITVSDSNGNENLTYGGIKSCPVTVENPIFFLLVLTHLF